MRFLLLLTAWGTAAFIPAYVVARPWQRIIGALAAWVLGVFGTQIEVVELDLFFPYDIAVFAALCLASSWAPWRRRLRTIAVGVPVMIALEVLSVTLAMASMVAAGTGPHATATGLQDAERFATGVIRVTGLVAAAVVWFYFVGRERLSLAARTWLGA